MTDDNLDGVGCFIAVRPRKFLTELLVSALLALPAKQAARARSKYR
jgi:hypothetical protein